MSNLKKIANNRRMVRGGLLSLFLMLAGGCANYKFQRAFEPLLDRDLAVDNQYRKFEDSLPGGFWQENMSTLKGMVNEKTEILNSLKALTPTPQNEALYRTLIDDINNSIAYLNIETNYLYKNTEYGAWLANAAVEGFGGTPSQTKKELGKAADEVLRLQDEMTAVAEKCNASQQQLAKLLQEKNLRRNYQPLQYTRYHKGRLHYKIQ